MEGRDEPTELIFIPFNQDKFCVAGTQSALPRGPARKDT